MKEQSSIIVHQYRGFEIPQRKEDGYVNLSALCKAHSKHFKNWHGTKTAKAYIAELSAVAGIAASELLIIKRGGCHSQGTWGHRLIAIEIAKWISASFAVWANQHLLILIETGSTSLNNIELIEPIKEEIINTSCIDMRSVAEYIDYLYVVKPMLNEDRELAKHMFTSILNKL